MIFYIWKMTMIKNIKIYKNISKNIKYKYQLKIIDTFVIYNEHKRHLQLSSRESFNLDKCSDRGGGIHLRREMWVRKIKQKNKNRIVFRSVVYLLFVRWTLLTPYLLLCLKLITPLISFYGQKIPTFDKQYRYCLSNYQPQSIRPRYQYTGITHSATRGKL